MVEIRTSALQNKLEVLKYQALGNSYLILNPRVCEGLDLDIVGQTDGSKGPSPQLVRRLCDVAVGIGSNGLLFGPFCVHDRDIFGLRIVNSDGTQAGFSGNGIRIFAQYLLDAGYARRGALIRIHPLLDDEPSDAKRIVPVRVYDDGSGAIDVTLPYAPKFGPDKVYAREGTFSPRSDDGNGFSFTVNALSRIGSNLTGDNAAWNSSTFVELGNPHCVTFLSDTFELPSLDDFSSQYSQLRTIAFQCSSKANDVPTFATGVNLQWAKIINRFEIEMVVFERGEGPTAASGSSACAAASAAFVRGLIDSNVTVNMPGGSLAVRIAARGLEITSVTLSGFASRILTASVNLEDGAA
jgi:diaminopimelate epimerase